MNLRSGKIAFTKAKKQNKTKNQKEVAWLEIQKDVGDKKKKKKKENMNPVGIVHRKLM